jgi:penicillin-binding protein 1A
VAGHDPRGRREPPLSRPARKREPAARRGGAARLGWFDRALRAVVLFALRWGWRIGSRLALGAALVLAVSTAWYWAQLPPAAALLDGRDRGSAVMLDRNGDPFAWRGENFGGALRAGEVSPHLVNAVIAAEDRRFHEHFGVDPIGLARAMLVNLRAGRLVQGGSTLTQQTAKNVFLTAERSLERKLKEIPMSFAMEIKYTKEEILSIYLNRVYLGAGAHGFEAAAQRYFGVSARLVGPAEAAMLAGLLKAPSRYAPTSNLADAQGRAAVIVGLMEAQGRLTPEQAARARAEPARLSAAAEARAGGAFADWVMESGPSWLTRQSAEDVVIATTFDPAAQAAAEAAVREVFATQVREGSRAQVAVAVLGLDGAVRALVGGREGTGAAAGQFNRATQALRQTGSAFKPIVYAAALEAGAAPLEVMEDRPITLGGWSPRNYDGDHLGPVTLTQALAQSINTVAVRLSERTGADRVRATARRLGVTAPLAPGPAVALGVSEATLLEMTGVYATFASAGRLAEPFGIRNVTLRGEAEPLMRHDVEARPQAISADAARRLTGMMQEVLRSGTGRRAALPDRPLAGKTGTTQAARDAWFIGWSSDFVVGVWMGYDDNTPLVGVTGGGLPAEIWREAMARLHEGVPPRPLDSVAPAMDGAAPRVASAPRPDRDEGVVQGLIAGVAEFLARGATEEGRAADAAAQSRP